MATCFFGWKDAVSAPVDYPYPLCNFLKLHHGIFDSFYPQQPCQGKVIPCFTCDSWLLFTWCIIYCEHSEVLVYFVLVLNFSLGLCILWKQFQSSLTGSGINKRNPKLCKIFNFIVSLWRGKLENWSTELKSRCRPFCPHQIHLAFLSMHINSLLLTFGLLSSQMKEWRITQFALDPLVRLIMLIRVYVGGYQDQNHHHHRFVLYGVKCYFLC